MKYLLKGKINMKELIKKQFTPTQIFYYLILVLALIVGILSFYNGNLKSGFTMLIVGYIALMKS